MHLDSNLSLEFGGHDILGPDWNSSEDEYMEFHRFLFPVNGTATLKTTHFSVSLIPGTAVFLPGYRQYQHSCENSCELYWAHVRPGSLYLDFLLAQAPKPFLWSSATPTAHGHVYQQLPNYFAQPSPAQHYRLQAYMLHLISDILEANQIQLRAETQERIGQLLPALSYMDEHYTDNPSLETIAERVKLNPIYFHRRFKGCFHTSPHTYMLRKRMNLARSLLSSDAGPILDIATQCGYANQFYFSRTFKQYFGVSPREFKKIGAVKP